MDDFFQNKNAGLNITKQVSISYVAPRNINHYRDFFRQSSNREEGWLDVRFMHSKSSGRKDSGWETMWLVFDNSDNGTLRIARSGDSVPDASTVVVPMEQVVSFRTDDSSTMTIILTTTEHKMALRSSDRSEIQKWLFAFQKSVALVLSLLIKSSDDNFGDDDGKIGSSNSSKRTTSVVESSFSQNLLSSNSPLSPGAANRSSIFQSDGSMGLGHGHGVHTEAIKRRISLNEKTSSRIIVESDEGEDISRDSSFNRRSVALRRHSGGLDTIPEPFNKFYRQASQTNLQSYHQSGASSDDASRLATTLPNPSVMNVAMSPAIPIHGLASMSEFAETKPLYYHGSNSGKGALIDESISEHQQLAGSYDGSKNTSSIFESAMMSLTIVNSDEDDSDCGDSSFSSLENSDSDDEKLQSAKLKKLNRCDSSQGDMMFDLDVDDSSKAISGNLMPESSRKIKSKARSSKSKSAKDRSSGEGTWKTRDSLGSGNGKSPEPTIAALGASDGIAPSHLNFGSQNSTLRSISSHFSPLSGRATGQGNSGVGLLSRSIGRSSPVSIGSVASSQSALMNSGGSVFSLNNPSHSELSSSLSNKPSSLLTSSLLSGEVGFALSASSNAGGSVRKSPLTTLNTSAHGSSSGSGKRSGYTLAGWESGSCSRMGPRSSNEDRLVEIQSFGGNSRESYFAVYDGHCGDHAAIFLQRTLHDSIRAHAMFESDVITAISESCIQSDNDFLALCQQNKWYCGTTALGVFLRPHEIVFFNIGDCHVVVSNSGKVEKIIEPHKPGRADETERITRAKGWITEEKELYVGRLHMMDLSDPVVRDKAKQVNWVTIHRVCGELAVSRSIGDPDYKKFTPGAKVDAYFCWPEGHEQSFDADPVIPNPECKIIDMQQTFEFFVLASDGLWDVVTDNEAIQVVSEAFSLNKTPAEAAEDLCELALKSGSSDNVSIIIVKFLHKI